MNRTQAALAQPVPRPRLWLRAGRIGGLVGWHGARLALRVGVGRLGLGRRPSTGTALGLELAACCEAAGATWCKFGQLLSMRPDLLGADATVPLARLRDQLPPLPRPDAAAIVATELGGEAAAIELDERPLASATMASVYRARLADGSAVAIKIRRPGVVDDVRTDVALMGAMANLLARLRPLRRLPIQEVVDHVFECVRQQLDFELEARNTMRLCGSMAPCKGIRIPRVVPRLSTDRVLTMELIEGLAPGGGAGHGEGTRRALRAALRGLYRMIFIDGLVHCDLHLGNLHLLDGGEAVMLDAGLVVDLDDLDRVRFARFFHGLVAGSGRDCSKVMCEAALDTGPRFDRDAFDAAVEEIIGAASGRSAAEFDVATFAMSMFEVQRRFDLRSTPSFVMPVMALLMFEGVAAVVDPELDFQGEARPFLVSSLLPRMMRERTSPFS